MQFHRPCGIRVPFCSVLMLYDSAHGVGPMVDDVWVSGAGIYLSW
jgi:hypothetical protein